MPLAPFLDLNFDLEFPLRISEEIEELVVDKEAKLKNDYEQWKKENDKADNASEWYQAQEDNFNNEWYFITELKRNIFNGLAVTINTIFERRVHTFIREIYKKLGTEDFNGSSPRPFFRISL